MDKPQTQEQAPHLAILPSPGMGHVIPLVEFDKRLVGSHSFTVTFLVPTDGPLSNSVRAVLNSLSEAIDHVFLPSVSFDDLPEGSIKAETRMTLTFARSLLAVRDVLSSLLSRRRLRLVGLVVDLFDTDAFDVVREFSISSYVFVASAAMALSLFLYLPKLDETTSCKHRELAEPVKIPGSVSIPGTELTEPVQDKKNDAYKLTLHAAKQYCLADDVMVNSFKDLEPGAISSFLEGEAGKPRVYPVDQLSSWSLPVVLAPRLKSTQTVCRGSVGSQLAVSYSSLSGAVGHSLPITRMS